MKKYIAEIPNTSPSNYREKFAELINDGQNHQGEFIELYPIVKED